MKTLKEIKQITNKAVEIEKKKQALLNKKLSDEKKRSHKENIKHAKDVSFFIKEIEKEALKGNSISLGEIDDYTDIQIKSIKKELKDFNPIFQNKRECSYSYNYDGGQIDGSEHYYEATEVTFNWK